MPRIEKTVFLSYRRADLGWARAIYQYLQQRGYDVFLDFTGVASGKFESVIIENIKARAHFLVLLTASALERCNQPNDWLRREIETAIATQRNVIPLMIDGFDFKLPEIAKQLNGTLAELKDYNGLPIPHAYFDDAMERLCDKYLKVAVDAKLHHASSYAREAAKKEQRAAATAAVDLTPNGRTPAKATRGGVESGLAEQAAIQPRAAEAQPKTAGEVQRKRAEEARAAAKAKAEREKREREAAAAAKAKAEQEKREREAAAAAKAKAEQEKREREAAVAAKAKVEQEKREREAAAAAKAKAEQEKREREAAAAANQKRSGEQNKVEYVPITGRLAVAAYVIGPLFIIFFLCFLYSLFSSNFQR